MGRVMGGAFSMSITDHKDEVLKAERDAVIKFLTEAGLHLEGEAKKELENDPRRIDTGNLRNSISSEVDSSEPAAYVGTNVEYAPYVHDGTMRMAPNRFLRNAFERNADQIKAKAEAALKGQ